MLDQKLKVSPHGSFNVSQVCKSVAICEAIKGDRHNWGQRHRNRASFYSLSRLQKRRSSRKNQIYQ